MPTEHWAILTIEYELTAEGYKITITTDIACHLYMRWTTIVPKEHGIPVLRRGLYMHTDKYFCFDSYEDNQQEEEGDTTTHTFIKEPWPSCETRYFYFHGTIADTASPSTTAIFTKHRIAPPYGPEQTTTFYCDADPEVSSVDGMVYRAPAPEAWTAIHDGAGTGALPSFSAMYLQLFRYAGVDQWAVLRRCILTFDTSTIPEGSLIVSAKLGWRFSSKARNIAWNLAPCVYKSNPASNIDLIPSDYGTLENTPLATPIDWDDLPAVGWIEFILNEAGLASIICASITKLGLRDATFDAPNTEPPGTTYNYAVIYGQTADLGMTYRPYLEVTYKPLL